jgi:exopolyphosphatase/guanosine-5'-triphosphate,3'-diphosphate pyrophosphatase
MRVAAIDVGTNSTRLLIAEVSKNSKLRVIDTDLKTTRLGAGINTGYLSENAIARTLGVVESFVKCSKDLQAEQIVIAATSAVRDATNGNIFVDRVYRRTGIKLSVLPGEIEAAISYRGVLSGTDGSADKLVVLDVGGGSTEISWQTNSNVQFASVNVGAVRMTEGGHSNEQIKALLQPLLKQIRVEDVNNLVAVGGTATTMAAIIQKMKVYDSQKIHGFVITLAQTKQLLRQLNALTIEERKNIAGIQPERADIIPAGVRIISQMLELLGVQQFTVSEADILWGLAISALNVDKKTNPLYQK